MSFNKETGMYEGYIYKIINDVNDKVYIGQTIVTIEHRYKCHLCDAKNNNDNMLIHKAINKYGYNNFHVCLIEKIACSTKQELIDEVNKKEKYYIDYYNSIRPNGYNISIGGDNTSLNKKTVHQYDINCNFIRTYESVVDASLMTGIGEAAIQKCCLHKSKSAGGFVWTYDNQIPKTAKQKERRINQYSLDEKFIRSYISILEACEVLKLDRPSISNCCMKKRYKTVGGYKWFYADDPNQPDKTKIIA